MISSNRFIIPAVLLAHLGLLSLLVVPRVVPQQPVMLLQTSLLPMASAQPAPEKPAAPDAAREVARALAKPARPKPVAKPAVVEQVAQSQSMVVPEKPQLMERSIESAVQPAMPAKAVAAADNRLQADSESAAIPETREAPSFHANYLRNPKPVYPPQSLALSEEGVVQLRVKVSAQGEPDAIELYKSSGFARLDAAAQKTVSRWRFVPARLGAEPVAGVVIVPVNFSIKRS